MATTVYARNLTKGRVEFATASDFTGAINLTGLIPSFDDMAQDVMVDHEFTLDDDYASQDAGNFEPFDGTFRILYTDTDATAPPDNGWAWFQDKHSNRTPVYFRTYPRGNGAGARVISSGKCFVRRMTVVPGHDARAAKPKSFDVVVAVTQVTPAAVAGG